MNAPVPSPAGHDRQPAPLAVKRSRFATALMIFFSPAAVLSLIEFLSEDYRRDPALQLSIVRIAWIFSTILAAIYAIVNRRNMSGRGFVGLLLLFAYVLIFGSILVLWVD